jgi:hypothetical protein
MRKISKSAKVLAAGTVYSDVLDLATMDGLTGIESNVKVTAKSGTSPTLDVTMQYSFDGTNWVDHTTYTQFTDVGAAVKTATIFGIAHRLKLVVGGSDTPTVTCDYHLVAR